MCNNEYINEHINIWMKTWLFYQITERTWIGASPQMKKDKASIMYSIYKNLKGFPPYFPIFHTKRITY